jgi:hypothetical protein
MEDAYWAASKPQASNCALISQVIDTIFCCVAAEEGFSPIPPQISGSVYRSFNEARCV